MKSGKAIYLAALPVAVILVLPGTGEMVDAWAGNKAQVEKRVEDLDRMNRSIISEIPDIPQRGIIEYKATVKEGKDGSRIQIIEKDIELLPEPEKTHSDEENKKNK